MVGDLTPLNRAIYYIRPAGTERRAFQFTENSRPI